MYCISVDILALHFILTEQCILDIFFYFLFFFVSFETDRSICAHIASPTMSSFPVATAAEQQFFTASNTPSTNGNNFINHTYIDSIGAMPLSITNTTTVDTINQNQSNTCCQRTSSYTSTSYSTMMSSHMT